VGCIRIKGELAKLGIVVSATTIRILLRRRSLWAGLWGGDQPHILGHMPVTVKIQDQSGAGRVRAITTLEGISSKITLRDLVRTRVREEVARYNAGPEPIFSGLVMPEGAEPTHEGFRMPRPRRIDWRQQADRAIQAFQRNGFFVLVDDRQVTELDEPLDLTADSEIRFVRLVQLVGG
jgi:hypothetical protein